jgi:hypothetical protein
MVPWVGALSGRVTDQQFHEPHMRIRGRQIRHLPG